MYSLRGFEGSLQPRDVRRGPIGHAGDLEPSIDVVPSGVDVAIADGRLHRKGRIDPKLEGCDNGIPSQGRRYIGSTWFAEPGRGPVEVTKVEEDDGVARILQIDDARRPPRRVARDISPVLVHETREGTVPKSREPGRRIGIAFLGQRAPERARERRAAPQCALDGIAEEVVQRHRALGVLRPQTETVEIELWPAVLRECRPVTIDLTEQRPRCIGAV